MMLDRKRYLELIEARINNPASLQKALKNRARRSVAGKDGKLMLLAADHTARGIIAAGNNPTAIADRFVLLDKLIRGLAVAGVDGVMASADILEELAWLGALEEKVAIGTMNRGGIIGATWELDDRLTAYDAEHIKSMGLDGGKTLLRIDETDPGVARTIEMVAQVTTQLADLELVSMIEPLPYMKNSDGRAVLDPSEEKLIKVVSIASALGSSSAFTWLKIPAPANPERVAAATSCPILLLGGDPGSNWEEVFAKWEKALTVPNIRGLVPGRALLYGEDLDVEAAVSRAAKMVRKGL
jgi:DhnA family fructose-bisphosphate aldolase class Ia